MECGQVLSISHCVPVPRHVDVVTLSTGTASKVIVSIRRTRVELTVVIAMEGNIQHPAIIKNNTLST